MPPTTATAPDVRKAAILLTCLPQEQAADILARLSPRQAEAVTVQIARLGRLATDEAESVVREFADASPDALGGQSGGVDLARSLAERAFAGPSDSTRENLRHALAALPFHFLKQIDPQTLLTYLRDEHPQTIALIISHLSPDYGARIVQGLSADRQLAVIRRIASMEPASAEVIQEVEQGLECRLSSRTNQPPEQAGGFGRVAQILAAIDRGAGRTLMENLAQDDPSLVEEIRRQLFPFEDLGKLSDSDLQTVLSSIETSLWALALLSATRSLTQRLLERLPPQDAAVLEAEIQRLGVMPRSRVEKARRQIVDVVLRLADAGAISGPDADK
jgi:flagellar motor switch protein FliG